MDECFQLRLELFDLASDLQKETIEEEEENEEGEVYYFVAVRCRLLCPGLVRDSYSRVTERGYTSPIV